MEQGQCIETVQRKKAGDKQRGREMDQAFADPQPGGQGQCIGTVQRKKAGDKQRGSRRGKWHGHLLSYSHGGKGSAKRMSREKGRGEAERQCKGEMDQAFAEPQLVGQGQCIGMCREKRHEISREAVEGKGICRERASGAVHRDCPE
jgi:hypothetical protein